MIGDIALFIKPNLVFLLAFTLVLTLPAFAQTNPGEQEDRTDKSSYSTVDRESPPERPTEAKTKETATNAASEAEALPEKTEATALDGANDQKNQTPESLDWKSKVSVAAGPLEKERAELLLKIIDGQKQGINILAYLNAFKSLEELVKSGALDSAIQQRIESIDRGLKDQLSRKEVLKNKAPLPMDKWHPKILAPGQVVPPEWRWRQPY